MAKVLTDRQKKERENNGHYFKNGKPKKSSMLCKSKQYIAEVTAINGHYNPIWACGGSRCPLYRTGCDNKGQEWQ